MLRAEGCDMASPFLYRGMAHTFDVRPAGPAQGMRDPPGSVRGIPRLEPGVGSALALVCDSPADAFVNVGAHRCGRPSRSLQTRLEAEGRGTGASHRRPDQRNVGRIDRSPALSARLP